MLLTTGLKLLYNVLTNNTEAEYSRYVAAEFATRLMHPTYRFSEFGRTWQEPSDVLTTYEPCVIT
jgi:hypothetical protein